ncbi:MAG TPA: class I SAM-dependent methyltransferase [Armatimonadota bacterium]|nr:class I SAM-dependent methyltransferase [Armatimonadota bacterium]
MTPPCRLCYSRKTELLHRGGKGFHSRDFYRCRMCGLVFVPDEFLLAPGEERARYELHENSADDAGYVQFLSNLSDELIPLLDPGAEGLDFGSGPTPVLCGLLDDAGFTMRGYDLYFQPDESALQRSYDFISCTETVEHFRDPAKEFDRLDGLLRPGGVLGVMTAMLDDWSGFADWHYPRDDTHICFYSPDVMRWIAARFGWSAQCPRPNVVLFRKP